VDLRIALFCVGVLGLSILLSSLFSVYTKASLKSILPYIGALSGVIVCVSCIEGKREIKNIVYVFFIACLLTVGGQILVNLGLCDLEICSNLARHGGTKKLYYMGFGGIKAGTFFFSARGTYGIWLSLLLGISLPSFTFQKNLFLKLFYFFAIVMCLIGAFLTASRSTYLAVCFIIVIYTLLMLYELVKTSRSSFRLSTVCSYLLFFTIVVFAIVFRGQILFALEKIVQSSTETIYNRIEGYKKGVEVFLSYPFFGIGMDVFSLKYKEVVPPHNIFIYSLSALGVVGGLSLLMLVGISFKSAVSCYLCRTRTKNRLFAFIPLLICLGVIIEVSFYNIFITKLLWFVLFFIIISRGYVRSNGDYEKT
jgi:hypothetical protein